MLESLFHLISKYNRGITLVTLIVVGVFTFLGYRYWFVLWSNPASDDLLKSVSKMIVGSMFVISFMFFHICRMAKLTKTSFLKALPKLLVAGFTLGGLAGYLLTIEDRVLQAAYLISVTLLISIFILIIISVAFMEILRENKNKQ